MIDLSKQQKVKVIHYPNNINDTPLVSVCVVTYQHVSYIKQCLDGILMQKTNFNIEILLGEDASIDGTREICIEYANKYPDKIRLFLHSRENNISINGHPTGRFNMLYNLKQAKGKYIALCEGDDYWTDPYKLQKQVDFLENNKEYSMCFHPVRIVDKDRITDEITNVKTPIVTTIDDLIKRNYIHTPSVVFRKNKIEFPEWFYISPMGDWPLHLFNSRFGKIYMYNEVMGIYRKNVGIFSTRRKHSIDQQIHFNLGLLALYEGLLKEFGDIVNEKDMKKKIIGATNSLRILFLLKRNFKTSRIYAIKLFNLLKINVFNRNHLYSLLLNIFFPYFYYLYLSKRYR